MTQIMYAISSSVFAAIFLVSIIVYGGETARALAVTSALFACYSQFIAQDHRVRLASVGMAYIAIVFGVAALLAFWWQ